MSSHRDFTPDDDEADELLLSAARPDSAVPAAQGDAPGPHVMSIRLKISGSSKASRAGSARDAGMEAGERVKHEETSGDADVDMDRAEASSSMIDNKPDLAKPLPVLDQKPATGSRKRVLSNPLDPPSSASTTTTTSRKRPKVSSQRKPKRKPAAHQLVDSTSLPSPGMYTADGDDLLADELSLMDEEVAKRSTRGSSPQYREDFLAPDHHQPPPLSSPPLPPRAVSPFEPLPSERLTVRERMTPESSPEITLLADNVAAVPRAVLVPIPSASTTGAPATAAAGTTAPVRKKKKAWLNQKTAPVAIAPNIAIDQTPPPPAAAGPSEKRKPARKSRAFKSSAVVSSPQLDPTTGDAEALAVAGEVYLDRGAAGEFPAEGTDAVEVKPKKKKSRKLKPGEVGPGKHWRKGLFGPHSARQAGADGGELGEASPRSTPGGSGRLILPKPSAGGAESRRSLFTAEGESTYDAGTPEYEGAGRAGGEYDPTVGGGSMRSSPEISMRNDPSISLARPPLQTRGSQMTTSVPAPRPKPLLEGANGQYIVPKVAAQVDDLGHPVYRNSILTRGISIIRIQDYSGAKAKEREVVVPRALKDNLGPRARQFADGYRVITGVGGTRLKFRSWIPRTATSEYRLERDAKIEEMRAREIALGHADSAPPSRPPGLWATATNTSQRSLYTSRDGATPDPAWTASQHAQIHLGQQVRKISAYAPAPSEADSTLAPPKKPAKKKKKKKVVKSAAELTADVMPSMPSPLLESVAPSSVAASPDVQVRADPMEGVRARMYREVSPVVDDLIMETV